MLVPPCAPQGSLLLCLQGTAAALMVIYDATEVRHKAMRTNLPQQQCVQGRMEHERVFNLYAAGGLFSQYKMMQKNWKKKKPWRMGTH